MNLSMDILRLLTVRAIRGRTWAGDRVFDSPATPADIRVEEERQPFIAIFVDEADVTFAEGMQQGMGQLFAPGTTRLVIEVGVSSPQTFDDDGNLVPADDTKPMPDSYVTQLNATDEGLELQIGFLTRQVMDCLASTSESNPWAELWRMLTEGQLLGVEIRRGGPQVEGKTTRPRYASRVTLIRTGVLSDPPRGIDLDEYPFWKVFLAVAEADDELKAIGSLVRAHLTQASGPQPDWRMAQKLMNLSKEASRHLGIAPVEGFDATTVTEHPVDPLVDVTITQVPHAD